MTERGREWWWPDGGVRRLELEVVWASSALVAGSHWGLRDCRARIGVVMLVDPKERRKDLHRNCLRRSPLKWKSDFPVSEVVISSGTFDAGW